MAVRNIFCLQHLRLAPSGGGALLSSAASSNTTPRRRAARPYRGKPRTVTSRLAKLSKAEPPVRALVVYNSNRRRLRPINNTFLQDSGVKTCSRRFEHFQTDTADYADIVLPATTQREHFDVTVVRSHLRNAKYTSHSAVG
jgi:anaerobic selenocysteine-containing dehydrogenase